jgi:hypothetical protein
MSLFTFTYKHANKTQWGKRWSSTLSLTSALEGRACQCHARPLYPREKKPDTRCTGTLVNFAAGLDGQEKSRPQRNLNSQSSRSYRVAIPSSISRQCMYRPTHEYSCFHAYLCQQKSRRIVTNLVSYTRGPRLKSRPRGRQLCSSSWLSVCLSYHRPLRPLYRVHFILYLGKTVDFQCAWLQNIR